MAVLHPKKKKKKHCLFSFCHSFFLSFYFTQQEWALAPHSICRQGTALICNFCQTDVGAITVGSRWKNKLTFFFLFPSSSLLSKCHEWAATLFSPIQSPPPRNDAAVYWRWCELSVNIGDDEEILMHIYQLIKSFTAPSLPLRFTSLLKIPPLFSLGRVFKKTYI